MRKYLFAVCSAAVFALPTSAAFSQVDVEVGREVSTWGLVTIATTTIATKAEAVEN